MKKTFLAITVAAGVATLPTGAAAFTLFQSAPKAQEQAPQAPVIKVQSGDAVYRIGQLEEQIRTLNGRVEELSFQILQMQDQMRQMQEDYEFRFQDLESGTSNQRGAVEPAGEATTDTASNAGSASGVPGVTSDITASTTPNPNSNGSATTGEPPRDLGTITFDGNGELVDQNQPVGSGDEFASLSTPEDIYQASYHYVLSGDYELAAQGFRDYIDVYPDGPQAADATFWLGESLYSQGNYSESAKTFLDAHQKFPTSEKAPEMLLKLGMSLAALDNVDTACATYREVLSRYPDLTPSVRAKVSSEQSQAGC